MSGKEITHEAGKAGWKRVLEVPSFVRQSPPPTLKLGQHKLMAGLLNISHPKSPLEKKTVVPREPNVANMLHTLVA